MCCLLFALEELGLHSMDRLRMVIGVTFCRDGMDCIYQGSNRNKYGYP